MVGRVGRPHGLDGSVVVDPVTDDPRFRFAKGKSVWLAGGEQLTVASYRATERSPVVRFRGISGREAAEGLRGRDLLIPASERRPLDAGEYWPDQLEGLEAFSPDGKRLGTVRTVEFGQGQDRLTIETPDGDMTVPFVAELVPEVDLPSGRVVVNPPEGLIG